MVFGDKQRFAIESEVLVDRPEGGGSLGRVALWVGGAPLGNIEDTVVLGTVAERLRRSLPAASDRGFDGKSPQEILQIIDDAIYGGQERSLEQSEADSERYWQFLLAPGLSEAFDSEFIAQFSDELGRHILWRKPDGTAQKLTVSEFEYRAAVQSFLDWARKAAHVDVPGRT